MDRGLRILWFFILLTLLFSDSPAVDLDDWLAEAESLLATNPTKSKAFSLRVWQRIETSADIPRQAQVLMLLADASHMLGQGEEAVQFADRGLQLETLSAEQEVRLYIARGLGFELLGRREEAIRAFDTGVAVARRRDAYDLLALARAWRGQCYAGSSEYELALEDVLAAHASINVMKSPQQQLDVLSALAHVYSSMGDYPNALKYHQQTLQKVREMNQLQQMAVACFNVAQMQEKLGNFEEAKLAFAESLHLSRQIQDPGGIAYALIGLASLDSRDKKYETAIDRLQQAIPIFDELEDQQLQIASRLELGEAYCKTGECPASLEYLHKALDLSEKGEITRFDIRINKALADTYAEMSDFELAQEHLREVITLQEKDFRNELDQTVAEVRVRLSTELKERENRMLANENLLRQLELEKQEYLGKFYSGLALAAALLAVILTFFVVKSAGMQRKLIRLAQTDELTGLANRRHVLVKGKDEFERARRHEFPLSVIIIDFDHFKQINDSHGHAVGDQVLRFFGDCCREVFRLNDHCGRMGGEEFIVILPHTDLEAGLRAAERIRAAVDNITLPDMKKQPEISISIGVSQFIPSHKDIESVIKQADDAMYQAKALGRNQVYHFSKINSEILET